MALYQFADVEGISVTFRPLARYEAMTDLLGEPLILGISAETGKV